MRQHNAKEKYGTPKGKHKRPNKKIAINLRFPNEQIISVVGCVVCLQGVWPSEWRQESVELAAYFDFSICSLFSLHVCAFKFAGLKVIQIG